MLLSMTGFSSHTFEVPINGRQVSVTILIKSVNSRFFECICKLPYALAYLETEIIKHIKSRLLRGTVTVTMHVADAHVLQGTVKPALSIVEGYIKAIGEIQKKYQLDGTLSIHDIVGLPNIFESVQELPDKELVHYLLTELEKILSHLLQERQREGAALEKDLNARLAILAKAIEEIQTRAVVILQERKDQLLRELQSGSLSADVQEQQMLIIQHQLEKMDIHEEIVRFKSHLDNINKTLQEKSVEKGKKLDFIVQEMMREINTLAAKCADAAISSIAITSKVELEKMREQIQNVV